METDLYNFRHNRCQSFNYCYVIYSAPARSGFTHSTSISTIRRLKQTHSSGLHLQRVQVRSNAQREPFHNPTLMDVLAQRIYIDETKLTFTFQFYFVLVPRQ